MSIPVKRWTSVNEITKLQPLIHRNAYLVYVSGPPGEGLFWGIVEIEDLVNFIFPEKKLPHA